MAGWHIPVTEWLLTRHITCPKFLTVAIIISCRNQMMSTSCLVWHCTPCTCPPCRVRGILIRTLIAAPYISWKFCLLLYDADTTYHLYILSSKVHMKKTECIYLKNPTTSRYMLHNKSKILPLNGKSITSSCLKNGWLNPNFSNSFNHTSHPLNTAVYHKIKQQTLKSQNTTILY